MTEPVDTANSHAYLSTACLHRLHDKCRLVCKYCDEPCWCRCHGKEPELATGGIVTAPIHIGHSGCVIDPMSETTLGITPERRSTNIEPDHCGLCGMGWNEHPPDTQPGTCLNFAPDEMKPTPETT